MFVTQPDDAFKPHHCSREAAEKPCLLLLPALLVQIIARYLQVTCVVAGGGGLLFALWHSEHSRVVRAVARGVRGAPGVSGRQ